MGIIAHCHWAGRAVGSWLANIWRRQGAAAGGDAAVAAPAEAASPDRWRRGWRHEVREAAAGRETRREAGQERSVAAAPDSAGTRNEAERAAPSVRLTAWQRRVLRACEAAPATGRELLAVAGYAARTGNFKRGLLKLRRLELLELSLPDRPRSKRQRYRLTQRGEAYLAGDGGG